MYKTPDHANGDEVAPLLHWSAAGAGTVIATGIAVFGGLLWTAAAFSSHEGWAYNHLAWWIGATIIAASLLGGAIAGVVSKARGVAAGTVNGAVTGAAVVSVAAVLAVLALAVHGSTNDVLALGGHSVIVDFARPWVAMWAAAGGLVAGAVGGVLGGLLPRSYRGYRTVKLATVREIDLTMNGAAPQPQPQHAASN